MSDNFLNSPRLTKYIGGIIDQKIRPISLSITTSSGFLRTLMTASQSSATAAALSLRTFLSTFGGVHAADPTISSAGDPILNGAFYVRSTDGHVRYVASIDLSGYPVWADVNAFNSDQLLGHTWTSQHLVHFGQSDFDTPNNGVTGGIRLRANQTTGNAYFQVLNYDAATQYGYWKYDSTGTAEWVGTGGLKYNGSVVYSASNDGSGSGSDADLLDGYHGTWYSDIIGRLGYTPADNATYNAPDVLSKLSTVDGSGSGLDSDLLDGQHGSYYSNIPARLGYTPLDITTYVPSDILSKLSTVDGSGSGLDSDLLDGQHGAWYSDIVARLTYTPVNVLDYIPSDVLTKLSSVDGSGSGLDSDLLDGQHGSYYSDIVSRLGYTPVDSADYTALDILSKLSTVDGSGSGLDADLLDGYNSSDFALLSSFVGSIAPNGYQPLPGGVILQWGTASTFISSGTNGTISFNTAFPVNSFVVLFSIIDTSSTYNQTHLANVSSNDTGATFRAITDDSGSGVITGFTWFAIGA